MQMHMLCLINQLVKINVFPNVFYEDVSKTAILRFCNIISKIIYSKYVRDFSHLPITTIKRIIDGTLEKKLLIEIFF